MNKVKCLSVNLQKGLNMLGFDRNDDSLFLTDEERQLPDPQIKFHLEKALDFQATAVYFRKQLNESYKPQVYLFDFTDRGFNIENEFIGKADNLYDEQFEQNKTNKLLAEKLRKISPQFQGGVQMKCSRHWRLFLKLPKL